MEDDQKSLKNRDHSDNSAAKGGVHEKTPTQSHVGKEAKVEARRLKGFRDFLPDAMETRLAVMDVIRREAKIFGFQSIATPALEYAQTLLGIGEETDKQSYRFVDHGGRAVGLRFDLTVPFARFVAEHQGVLSFPFKKLQIGEVWRGENTQKGRYREFAQCDLDIIGTDSPMADAEILALFTRILNCLQFGAFTVGVGSRKVLSGLIGFFFGSSIPEGGGLKSSDLEKKILVAIDKLAKIGSQGVVRILTEDLGLEETSAKKFLDILEQKDVKGESDLGAVKQLFATNLTMLHEIEQLETIVKRARRGAVLSYSEPSLGKIKIDLSIARGLGYYTGVVFESTIDALPGFGSVCSGGRYDDLVNRFIDRDLRGIGGSIGLDRLVAALEELGQGHQASKNKSFFVAIASEDAWDYGLDLALEVRSMGIPCHLGFQPKIGNQLKYADRIGSTFVLIVGSDELKSQTITVKDMKEGVQKSGISRTHLAVTLREMMA